MMKHELEDGFENTENLYYGLYRGIIASTDDPQNIGRVQLIVPQLYGEEVYDYWAFPRGMFAGKNAGFFFMPEENDKVWVSFENGNPRFPIWEYGWWGEGDMPKTATTKNKVIQTHKGHRIEFDDENNILRITDVYDHVVEMNSKGVSIISDNISLGTLNKSAEPAVLGDTLMDLLSDMVKMLGGIKAIQTSNGITSAISTAPNWEQFEKKWTTEWEKFKSKVNSID